MASRLVPGWVYDAKLWKVCMLMRWFVLAAHAPAEHSMAIAVRSSCFFIIGVFRLFVGLAV
jgi:hypothetical protein